MNRSTHSHRFLTGLGVASACWLAFGVLPASALTATDVELLGSPRMEILPAASGSLLTWSESTVQHPRVYSAYVRALHGGPITKLNDDGTKGFAGGIDGSEVVFQQSSQRRSDIRIYDTSSGHNVHVPTGVNTKEWEWGPMMSGTFMLFGRERFTRTRYAMRIILHNTATGHETVLDGARGHFGNKGPYVIPGQVNGDYATWQRCDVKNSCDVFVRKISSAHDVRLPDHGQEYAPSVASDGAVFFVRSRRGCGTEARLMRYEHGSATLVRDFARNRDSFETYAVSSTQVVREVNNCKTGDSNINLTTIT